MAVADCVISPGAILLTGRAAVVTGAAQGLGRATAIALARFGADVAICDRNRSGLDDTAWAIGAAGRTPLAAVLDVRDDEAVGALMQHVADRYGHIDVLVNNAGGVFFSDFMSLSVKGEDVMVRENFGSVTSCVRNAVPFMRERGGSIVNLTSIEAHRAAPGFAVYAAMKAAVANLSKSLAVELAADRIRVNCIAPDFVPTEGMRAVADASAAADDRGVRATPWPDAATPDDCAAAVVFLSSDMSRFITGVTIHLDGGTHAAHGWKVKSSGGFTL